MIVDITKHQLSIDESKVKIETVKLSIENRVLLMKQVKYSHDDWFIDRKTFSMFPEANEMLYVDWPS